MHMNETCETDVLEDDNDVSLGGSAAENPLSAKNKSALDKLAAKHNRIAKDLYEAALIHGAYGALDGWSTGVSMTKYFFDTYFKEKLFSIFI